MNLQQSYPIYFDIAVDPEAERTLASGKTNGVNHLQQLRRPCGRITLKD